MNIKAIAESLTLEEKAALLQGWTTWTTWDGDSKGIRPLFLADGPHGLRKQAGAGDHLGLNASLPSTCFPTAATVANSWNLELGEQLGSALGGEARHLGVDVILGPGLNIKRSPLCGRNFEYFSEDPYLAGKMAAAYIRGIQSAGVSACPKHFAVNSQELRRMSMNAVLDERTLREIYLSAFEIAVKEGGAKTIMSSYNRINGTYANEHEHLLHDILRDEWGFDGVVVTDWGGDNDHAAAVKAGSNLVMPAPGPDCAATLLRALEKGEVGIEDIDARVNEILHLIADLSTGDNASTNPAAVDFAEHHLLARKCAAESIVLLENDGILPLNKENEVALIGDFARTPRYQGSGSSQVNPTEVNNLEQELKAAGLKITGFAPGFSRTNGNVQQALIDEAVALAKKADVVLLCVGLDEISESEGMDRTHLDLASGQRALITAVCEANANVVLVLTGGAPFIMPASNTYRAAIHGYLGGQAGAAAMADALAGKINPSGKLSESWPETLAMTPAYNYFPSKERNSEYREAIYVGYRYYDKADKPLRYAFGHGISYTEFEYADLELDNEGVTFTLTNSGKVAGSEIVQLYISCPDGKVFRPLKELKAFAKIALEPGESRRVTLAFDDKTFRYFNIKTNKWEIESGTYSVLVAAAADDIRLRAELEVTGTDAPLPYGDLPSYEEGKIANVGDEEFARLLGTELPQGAWGGELEKNDAICQLYYAKSPVGRLIWKILTMLKNKAEAAGKPDLNILFLYNMPFRALAKMSGGMVSEKMVDSILYLVNGHFFTGLGRIFKDFLTLRKENADFMRKLGMKK